MVCWGGMVCGYVLPTRYTCYSPVICVTHLVIPGIRVYVLPTRNKCYPQGRPRGQEIVSIWCTELLWVRIVGMNYPLTSRGVDILCKVGMTVDNMRCQICARRGTRVRGTVLSSAHL